MESFVFTNGFRCSDVQKFEKLNFFSINIFELDFYQDQNKWRHKLIPNEVSKNDSDRVIDLLICRRNCAPNKKLNAFLGDHKKSYMKTMF